MNFININGVNVFITGTFLRQKVFSRKLIYCYKDLKNAYQCCHSHCPIIVIIDFITSEILISAC